MAWWKNNIQWYNCNNKDECPLENECLTPRIVYRADVTNNKTDEHKYYYGISDTPFGKRNTFINNCNLRLSKKAFIIRNLDDVNMLNKRLELYQSADI